jgi:hypothetical protein
MLLLFQDYEHREAFDEQQTRALLILLQQMCGKHIYRYSWAAGSGATPDQQGRLKLPTYGDAVTRGTGLLCMAELPWPPLGPPANSVASASRAAIHGGPSFNSILPRFANDELSDLVWPPGSSATLWANDPTPEGTLSTLVQQIQQQEPSSSNQVLYASCAVTPRVTNIIGDTVSRALVGADYGLEPYAARMHALLKDLITAVDLAGVTAVCMDYVGPAYWGSVAALVGVNLARAAKLVKPRDALLPVVMARQA